MTEIRPSNRSKFVSINDSTVDKNKPDPVRVAIIGDLDGINIYVDLTDFLNQRDRDYCVAKGKLASA